MTSFRRGMQISLLATVAGLVAWETGLLEAFGFGWEVLFVPLALSLLAILFGIADSLTAPTPGKVLWLVGIGLLVGPFVSDAVPVVAVFGAFVAFALARFQRIREVYLG